jgi:hypothetical protein
MYIVLRDSQDSRKASDADKSPLARIRSASAWSGWDVLKQQVDPLGRIFPAND